MTESEELAELLARFRTTPAPGRSSEAEPTPADAEPVVITEAGVYFDVPHAAYHADPVPGGSLSHSGARKLMPPSTPARFHYERQHPAASSDAMEYGSYAHSIVLGTGQDITVVDAGDWKSAKAQQARNAARAAGGVALLRKQHDLVLEMAAAIESDPRAMALLKPPGAAHEASLFWKDEPTGPMLRTRLDVLPKSAPGRMLVADYKTADSADDEAFGKSAANYGYDTQAAWTLDAIRALNLADDAAFLFVVQEKKPPYLVNVVQLTESDLMIGRKRNRDAVNLYARCVREDRWPGYGPGIAYVSLPAWYHRQHEDAFA